MRKWVKGGLALLVGLSLSIFHSAPRPSFWGHVRLLDGPRSLEEWRGDPTDEEVVDSIRGIPTHYATAYTEFYTDSANGSNLAGGSDAGSPSMTDTVGTGSWVSTTQVYVSVATTGSVAVGQFMSLYTGSPTSATTVARIINVSGGSGSAWTITLSNTAYSGTQPSAVTTGATFKAQVGGAWQGPTGAVSFPFGFVTNVLTDSVIDYPCVNMKNNATYNITAAMTHSLAGPALFVGYTSTVRDGGRATIDGGTSGTSYTLLTPSGAQLTLQDLIFQNNGATGSAIGLAQNGNSCTLRRCVINSIRGHGIQYGNFTQMEECELYACNQSNTSNLAAVYMNANGNLLRCTIHDNAGSNGNGIRASSGYISGCILDSNGAKGIFTTGVNNINLTIQNCEFYNNGGDGISLGITTNTINIYAENCNFCKNGGYGVNGVAGVVLSGHLINCGFGSGTQVNTSGQTNNLGAIQNINPQTWASGTTPWNSPSTGDFTITLPAAKNAGRGAFTQTGSGKTGTVGYPDVGAAQHLDAPASGWPAVYPVNIRTGPAPY